MGPMYLTSVAFTNFRSYRKRTFGFSRNVTLILGPNTAGKTNIIEGVAAASLGGSFRAQKDSDMVALNAAAATVTAVVSHDGQTDRLEMMITNPAASGAGRIASKRYTVNGVPRRQADFLGKLRSVVFWPNDLVLIIDSPSVRRRYLDMVLSQADAEYRRTLASYERAIRQRNKLLDLIAEGNAKRSQLFFWDQLLVANGTFIHDKRDAFISYVNTTAVPTLPYIIHYDHSIISPERLASYADAEIASRSTLVGPHRDDISFGITKHETEQDIARFGSRGEQRLAVLWLKLAELSYLERSTGERPILLLDDIFSELDEESREIVLAETDKQQTIITSAEEESVDRFLRNSGRNDTTVIRLPQDAIAG